MSDQDSKIIFVRICLCNISILKYVFGNNNDVHGDSNSEGTFLNVVFPLKYQGRYKEHNPYSKLHPKEPSILYRGKQ